MNEIVHCDIELGVTLRLDAANNSAERIANHNHPHCAVSFAYSRGEITSASELQGLAHGRDQVRHIDLNTLLHKLTLHHPGISSPISVAPISSEH